MLHRCKIRVHRKDSAFVYAILESLEGMASYSTLAAVNEKGFSAQDFRDLELFIPDGFKQEFDQIFEMLAQRVPIVVLSEGEGQKE